MRKIEKLTVSRTEIRTDEHAVFYMENLPMQCLLGYIYDDAIFSQGKCSSVESI